jgi:hypothetical protein
VNFLDYLKKGWEAVQLKMEAIESLASDEKAFGPAIGILAIGGVAMAIGTFNPVGIILYPIVFVVGAFVAVGLMHLAATLIFGATGDFKSLINVIGCASIVRWIGVVPLLGPVLTVLAGLWLLVVGVLTVEKTYKLDRGKSVIVVAVPVVLALVLAALLYTIVGFSMLMMGNR